MLDPSEYGLPSSLEYANVVYDVDGQVVSYQLWTPARGAVTLSGTLHPFQSVAWTFR